MMLPASRAASPTILITPVTAHRQREERKELSGEKSRGEWANTGGTRSGGVCGVPTVFLLLMRM